MGLLLLLARLYLGAIWALAGIGKLAAAPQDVLLQDGSSDPGRQRRRAMQAFSLGEVGLAGSLIAGLYFPVVPLLSATLFAGFAIPRFLGKASRDCGCFGGLQSRRPVGSRQLLFWAGLSAWLAVGTRTKSGQRKRSAGVATVVVFAAAGLASMLRARQAGQQQPLTHGDRERSVPHPLPLYLDLPPMADGLTPLLPHDHGEDGSVQLGRIPAVPDGRQAAVRQ